ncbi:MAG: prepilin peptidase [candidate division WOR-3 bacterium]
MLDASSLVNKSTLSVIVFIFGLAIGSFLNVCIHRIPRNQSLLFPASHCPKCKKPIKPFDNIPVLSYIILGGKCRNCKKPISLIYPTVELVTAILFTIAFLKFGLTWSFLRAVLFFGFLIVVTFIDLQFQIAPFQITIPGLIVGILTSFLLPQITLSSVLGMLLGGLFVLLVWVLWRYLLSGLFQVTAGIKQKEGIGWGDLPLTAMIGAFLGWRNLLVAIFVAVIVGVFIGLILRVSKKNQPGQPIAFGPFLAIGGVVGLLFGEMIANWYLNQFLR